MAKSRILISAFVIILLRPGLGFGQDSGQNLREAINHSNRCETIEDE